MPARKKKITTIEEIPDDAPLLQNEREMESDAEMDTLERVLQQFGPGSVKLKISKKTSKGDYYCFSQNEIDVDEDFIQQTYGGGDYSVRIFINGEFKDTVPLKIAEPLNRPNSNGPNLPPSSANDNIVVQLIRSQNEFLQNLLQSKQAIAPTPVGELASAMKDLGIVPNGGIGEKGIELFMKGLEFAKDLNGSTDWKSDLFKTIRDVIPQIGQHLKTLQPETQQLAPMNDQQKIETMLKSGIAYLKKQAIKGVSPDLYIEWIMSHVDEEQYAYLLRLAVTTEFAEFAKLDAEIGNEVYLGWFKSLYDGLRSAYHEQSAGDGEVESDSDGVPGDATNVSGHGAVGTKPNGAGKAVRGTV